MQIHIDDRDSEGIFRSHFDYQIDKFTEQEIEHIYCHVTNLLFDAINNDRRPLYALEILSADEKQKLLCDFNDTAADYPKDKCVHQLFVEQVGRTPNKTAVIACDRTLTYAELNEQANRIANGLIEQGVEPGNIVAFMLPRRSYLIAAILGVLKAGAAYLPIDPDYPQDRIHYMLEDSKASYFITKENIGELLANTNSENPCVAISNDSPSYCIYTSGTTGTPKGAIIRHRNLVNFCSDNIYNNLQHSISQNCNVVLACGSIVFDISNFEIVLSLLLNKSVVFANEAEIFDANLLANLIFQNSIDCIHCTPTKLRTYLDNPKFASVFSNVKCIMVGGEQLTEDVYRLITKYSQALVFNGYGPTETTMGVSFGQEYQSGITIGKPIANTQIYIVDHYLQPVPVGVTGELCIAGDGVGAGYLNRPELTAEKFIDNPFREGNLYKTGDLAYWSEDGNIIYVGRNDFQVKIRGLRIELGEIENAISTVEGVSQAVVVVRKDATGRQFICAFYTENAFVPIDQIRVYLRKKLPRYMIPHVFTRLMSLTLTSSGKVNRNALPLVDLTDLQSEVEYIAPETPPEIAIIAAVQDVLGIEKVSMLDNFFDLGGDSLKAIEMIASLESAGFHIDTKTIFSCETMMKLAAALEVAGPIEDEIIPTGDIPATAAQLRVYTAQEMQGGTAYNVPYVFRAKSIDLERLQRAVEQLINRHETLRTRFENQEGKIMQITEDSVPFTLECLDDADISTFVRPFDLSKAPLIRVAIMEIPLW